MHAIQMRVSPAGLTSLWKTARMLRFRASGQKPSTRLHQVLWLTGDKRTITLFMLADVRIGPDPDKAHATESSASAARTMDATHVGRSVPETPDLEIRPERSNTLAEMLTDGLFAPETDLANRLVRRAIADSAAENLSLLASADIELPAPTAHPNGFVVMFLGGSRAHGSLRLHVWPANDRPMLDERDAIHDHVFDFTSRIAVGALDEDHVLAIPTTSDDPRGYEEWAAYYRTDSSNELRATGRRIVPMVYKNNCYAAGTTYDFAAGDFHRSAGIANAVTATLMCSGPSRLEAPRLLRSPNHVDMDKFVRNELTAAQTRALVDEVLAAS